MSFDQGGYSGQNAYLPLWQLHFRQNQTIYRSPQLGDSFRVENFLNGRRASKVPKKFACAFISNLDPRRMRAIEALRQYGEVDVFGKKFGNFAENKAMVARNYRYVLAFENDFYPGYVTEKIFDAYACSSVPLYWGSFGVDNSANFGSFLDVSNFENFESFAAYISQLSSNEWRQIYEQPLMNRLPDFSKISQMLIGK